MRALTIRQPWAELICAGFKDVENRFWRYRNPGDLLIHAGKVIDTHAVSKLKEDRKELVEVLESTFTLGAILGICRVKEILWRSEHKGLRDGSQFSSWHEVGCWGWYLTDVCKFDKPIPFRGMPGLFNVPDDIYLKASELWDEHPEGYDYPCLCKLCRSYGD